MKDEIQIVNLMFEQSLQFIEAGNKLSQLQVDFYCVKDGMIEMALRFGAGKSEIYRIDPIKTYLDDPLQFLVTIVKFALQAYSVETKFRKTDFIFNGFLPMNYGLNNQAVNEGYYGSKAGELAAFQEEMRSFRWISRAHVDGETKVLNVRAYYTPVVDHRFTF